MVSCNSPESLMERLPSVLATTAMEIRQQIVMRKCYELQIRGLLDLLKFGCFVSSMGQRFHCYEKIIQGAHELYNEEFFILPL